MQRPIGIDQPTECRPLLNVDELLKWEARYENVNNVATSYIDKNTKLPSRPRTLVCHDFKGGYLEDRFPQGSSTDTAYRFFHWPYVDIFVYFSHHFITIPPPCWTNAAHKHNVLALGTVITEWKVGEQNCAQFLSSEKSYRQAANQLVNIAKHYGFDGWLINIENQIQTDRVWLLHEFVQYLTRAMHSALPHSQVIWYDSVIDTGDLKWQDQLCEKNKLFFDVCDGIFLNYCWNTDKLNASHSSACLADRPWDVYVGVDVFGRGCLGVGGFNTSEAVAACRGANLSAAIFAPGWVFERFAEGDMEVFTPGEYKFWRLLSSYLTNHHLQELPFYTDFCQGQGHALYRAGKVICDTPWTNLTFQSLQPLIASSDLSTDKTQTVDFTDAFQGGACLKIGGQLKEAKDCFYSKLYSFDTPLLSSLGSDVLIAYTVQCPASCVVWMDVEMQHTTSDETQIIKYRLCSQDDDTALYNVLDDSQGAALTVLPVRNQRVFENVILMEETGTKRNEKVVDNRQLSWETRCFKFCQLSAHTIQSLSVGLVCTQNSDLFPLTTSARLGQIQISNTKDLPALPKVTPEVTSSQISQDDKISNLITVSCELQWQVSLEADVNQFMIYCTKVPRGRDKLSVQDDTYCEHTKLMGRVPRSRIQELHSFKMCHLEVNLDCCELLQFRVQPVHYNGIFTSPRLVPVTDLFLSLD